MPKATMSSEGAPVDDFALSVVHDMIGADWKNLGRRLGVKEPTLDCIAIDCNSYGVREMSAKTLQQWKQEKPDAFHLGSLIECLKVIKRNDIVTEILNKPDYRNSAMVKGTQENFLQEIRHNLKALYSNLEMRGLPWMKKVKPSLKDYYVELSLNLKKEKHQSRSIKLEEIFTAMKNGETKEKPSRILVEGAMGYGKTTLSSKLCFDWARNDKYIRYFDMVLYLPLRNAVSELDEMLITASRVSDEQRGEFKPLIKDNSKQVLIILDGLDELTSLLRERILPQLQRYKHATVVATSRPGKSSVDSPPENEKWFTENTGVSADLNKIWDRKLNIVGISEKMQLVFMNKCLPNNSSAKRETAPTEANKLKQTNINNLLPSEFLKCPLFLLIILLMITENKTFHEVKTKTDLYKYLFNFVLQRYLVVKKNYEKSQMIDMFDLEVNSSYIQTIVQFGEICLNALELNQLFFNADDLPECNGICEVAEIGFLTKNVLQDGVKTKETYEPIHKSMMEFAAAYRLWLSFTKGPRDCWNKHIPLLEKLRPQYNSSTSSFLFVFLAGLLGKKAGGLFDVLRPFASEYSEWFGSLCYPLMELEGVGSPTNNDIGGKNEHHLSNYLLSLLPNTWLVRWENDDQGFSTTVQHAAIIQLGINTQKIDTIKWNVHEEATFPKDLQIGKLIVEFTEPTVAAVLSKKNKLSCKVLFVSVQSAIINVQGFQDVIQAIDFQRMSVALRNDASVVRLSYKDVRTAMADVKNNMIYLCGYHIKYLQIFLMSCLTNLVRQDALATLDMKLTPQETEVYFSYFSFTFVCAFLSSLASNYLQDLYTQCLPLVCFIFIFAVISSHLDGSVDVLTNWFFSLLFRIQSPSFLVQQTPNVCQYIPFRILTFMVLILITHFLRFSSLYKLFFCVSVACFMPQTTHINIVIKTAAFILLKNYLFEFFSPVTIVNGCLLIYSMFCVNFAYHLHRQLTQVWGAIGSSLYFFLFLSFPFFVPIPFNVILLSVLCVGFIILLVIYPSFPLFLYFHADDLLLNQSCHRIDHLSPTPNDRIHKFFKNFFLCTCFCFAFHCVVYILFSASSAGHMRDYICPLLPILPTFFPSFIFSWVCRLTRCKQVSEKHFEELIKYVGTSLNLKKFILVNQCNLGWFPKIVFLFAVDLSELCNQGLKSWEWLQIEDVEIKCSKKMQKEFEIQHLEFSNADLSNSDVHDNFLRFCKVTSLVCSSSFLNTASDFWSVQKHSLKELYLNLDETFCASTEMHNLNVFGVTINALENISVSLINILNESQLTAFEIWNVENNFLLACNLIESIVKMLESEMDGTVYRSHSKLHVLSKAPNRLKLNQLMLLTDIVPNGRLNRSSSYGYNQVLHLLELTAMLKKLLLENSLLQLDIVCHRELVHYMSVHESEEIAGSWVEAFPPHQGFQVTHSLWGTAAEDSIRSKGVARRYPDRYHRFSISAKEYDS